MPATNRVDHTMLLLTLVPSLRWREDFDKGFLYRLQFLGILRLHEVTICPALFDSCFRVKTNLCWNHRSWSSWDQSLEPIEPTGRFLVTPVRLDTCVHDPATIVKACSLFIDSMGIQYQKRILWQAISIVCKDCNLTI